MFIDLFYQIFGFCTNPIEYAVMFLLIYMFIDIVIRIIGSLVGSSRRV